MTYTGCVCEPSLVMTPSLSISICLKVLTFCRISSSVYLRTWRTWRTQWLVKEHRHSWTVIRSFSRALTTVKWIFLGVKPETVWRPVTISQMKAVVFNDRPECSGGAAEANCHPSSLPVAHVGAVSSSAITQSLSKCQRLSPPDRVPTKHYTQPSDVYSDDSLSTSPDPGWLLVRARPACHVLFCRQVLYNSLSWEDLGGRVRSFQRADTDRILPTAAVAHEKISVCVTL